MGPVSPKVDQNINIEEPTNEQRDASPTDIKDVRLVRVVMPSLKPFKIDTSDTVGYHFGIMKRSNKNHQDSKLIKLFKNLLLWAILVVPQLVFAVAVTSSPEIAWVGALTILPGVYLALVVHTDIFWLVVRQFQAMFLGFNMASWLFCLFYAFHSVSIRIGALLVVVTGGVLMCWDSFPLRLRQDYTPLYILPMSGFLIYISFTFFLGGVALDHAELRIINTDVDIAARMSTFAATAGIYGLSHVLQWTTQVKEDFSTIRVPAISIKLPEHAVEELAQCLTEIRSRARKRSRLFSRRWSASKIAAEIAQPRPSEMIMAVLSSHVPVVTQTRDTIAKSLFGQTTSDILYMMSSRFSPILLSMFMASHYLFLKTLEPGFMWMWWISSLCIVIPSVSWMLIMNSRTLGLLTRSFESYFLLLNLIGLWTVTLIAFQDWRAKITFFSYTLTILFGCLSDAFPRAMLTFKVRLLVGTPVLVVMFIFSLKLFTSRLEIFQDYQYCWEAAANSCLTRSDIALGFCTNLYVLLAKASILVIPSSSTMGSLTVPVSILRMSDTVFDHYRELHERWVASPDTKEPLPSVPRDCVTERDVNRMLHHSATAEVFSNIASTK